VAKDLYVSDFFQKAYQYALLLKPEAIYILSAKYGLLTLERTIEPYEMTLNKMKVAERKEWSKKVLRELGKNADLKKDNFIFLCGKYYREYLLPEIYNYEIPMEGLRNGLQSSWLKEKLKHEHV
jgi:hypothetical protein